MRRAIIGDTHGRSLWKRLAFYKDIDEIVFIGDYVDSWDIPGSAQVENFLDTIAYKKSSEKIVKMLIGNHDRQYFKNSTETYSGFQEANATVIRHVFEENMEHLQMAYAFGNTVCTHAGVGDYWLGATLYKGDFSAQSIADHVNWVWKERPDLFDFSGIDGYGDDITQTPIWIRPQSLFAGSQKIALAGTKQVVGHTGVRDLIYREDMPFTMIDVLSSQDKVLVEENGVFSVLEF